MNKNIQLFNKKCNKKSQSACALPGGMEVTLKIAEPCSTVPEPRALPNCFFGLGVEHGRGGYFAKKGV